jgi:hypothetical protein
MVFLIRDQLNSKVQSKRDSEALVWFAKKKFIQLAVTLEGTKI